jgi:short-subunit dehydrogenase
MKLAGSRILVTGASSGIGRCLALELTRRGAHLALLARDARRITAVAHEARDHGGSAIPVPFDLARRDGYAALARETITALGGLDGLVNNAGVSSFSAFAEEDPEGVERLIDINVKAPLMLARAVLPHFLQRNAGHIVNIGSIFGSIAFPHFAAYSATKFALRGFSEALRRELCETGVRVSYIAPRTTATDINSPAARAFMTETGAAVDAPQAVARLIADAIERDRAEVFVGGPENVFVRLNGVAPRFVDRALAKHNRIADRLLRDSQS